MQKSKILETSLVLTTGFLIVFLITSIQSFLYLAIAFGIIGIFIKPLAKVIAILWFKLADVLNFIVSKVVLGTLFFVVLFPISIFYRLSNKDKLQVKKSEKTTWIMRNHNYSSADLENIW